VIDLHACELEKGALIYWKIWMNQSLHVTHPEKFRVQFMADGSVVSSCPIIFIGPRIKLKSADACFIHASVISYILSGVIGLMGPSESIIGGGRFRAVGWKMIFGQIL
jgi:hypothetical protein